MLGTRVLVAGADDLQIIRLIAEVIALLVFFGTGGWYVVRQVWRVLRAVEHLDGQTVTLAQKVEGIALALEEHNITDDARFAGLGNRLSHIEGRLGLPLGGKPDDEEE